MEIYLGASEKTHQVKALAISPDGLSLIPQIHMVKGESQSHKLSSDCFKLTHKCTCTQFNF